MLQVAVCMHVRVSVCVCVISGILGNKAYFCWFSHTLVKWIYDGLKFVSVRESYFSNFLKNIVWYLKFWYIFFLDSYRMRKGKLFLLYQQQQKNVNRLHYLFFSRLIMDLIVRLNYLLKKSSKKITSYQWLSVFFRAYCFIPKDVH